MVLLVDGENFTNDVIISDGMAHAQYHRVVILAVPDFAFPYRHISSWSSAGASRSLWQEAAFERHPEAARLSTLINLRFTAEALRALWQETSFELYSGSQHTAYKGRR